MDDQFRTAIWNNPLSLQLTGRPLKKPVTMDEFSCRRTGADLTVADHRSSKFQEIPYQFLAGIGQNTFRMKLNTFYCTLFVT